MLNYKHAYHAGNHADVLKHVCLIYFIKSIKYSYNSILYIDTHAGSGYYDQNNEYIQKNKEHQTGIEKMLSFTTNDPYLRFYLKTINNINKSNKLKFYPGSPKIIQHLTDKLDELYFYELHTNEFRLLKNKFLKNSNIKIINDDGFRFPSKIKIKKQKKGIILIDPSYEEKDDHEKVINLINKNYEQLENKIIIIWYPMINRNDTNDFIDGFKKTGIQNILRIEMPIQNDNEEINMTGSGLLVFNAHNKTKQSLRGTIIELQKCLQLKGNKKKVIVNYLR